MEDTKGQLLASFAAKGSEVLERLLTNHTDLKTQTGAGARDTVCFRKDEVISRMDLSYLGPLRPKFYQRSTDDDVVVAELAPQYFLKELKDSKGIRISDTPFSYTKDVRGQFTIVLRGGWLLHDAVTWVDYHGGRLVCFEIQDAGQYPEAKAYGFAGKVLVHSDQGTSSGDVVHSPIKRPRVAGPETPARALPGKRRMVD